MDWTFTRLSTGRWEPRRVGSFFADRDLCGVSGNDGLLRFHDDQSGPIAQEFVDSAFGSRGVHADVFAYDWRARQFAVSDSFDADLNYVGSGGTPMIVTLDPFDMVTEPWGIAVDGFEHALTIPMVTESLAPELFDAWRTANGVGPLTLEQCAGASVPGFYGARLEVANFTLDHVVVYLSFTAQLWAHAQTQQPGDPAPFIEME